MNEDFTYEDTHTFIDRVARYFDQFGLIRVHWQKVKKKRETRLKKKMG